MRHAKIAVSKAFEIRRGGNFLAFRKLVVQIAPLRGVNPRLLHRGAIPVVGIEEMEPVGGDKGQRVGVGVTLELREGVFFVQGKEGYPPFPFAPTAGKTLQVVAAFQGGGGTYGL